MIRTKGIYPIVGLLALVSVLALSAPSISAEQKKPNIIMIMGDDVGMWNISTYHRGMMGGSTPNIDRIAREGALFTDYYAQQSCTAGRAAFILGQTPFRTGLLKVGADVYPLVGRPAVDLGALRGRRWAVSPILPGISTQPGVRIE